MRKQTIRVEVAQTVTNLRGESETTFLPEVSLRGYLVAGPAGGDFTEIRDSNEQSATLTFLFHTLIPKGSKVTDRSGQIWHAVNDSYQGQHNEIVRKFTTTPLIRGEG